VSDKYTRQQLKEDKVQETAATAAKWLSLHRKGTRTTIAAALAAVLVIGGGSFYWQHHTKWASMELGKAAMLYSAPVGQEYLAMGIIAFKTDQERLIAAKNAYYAVSQNYAWTEQGQAAHVMAAGIEAELGNDAIATQQFTDASKGLYSRYNSLAAFALAAQTGAAGKKAEAAAQFGKLAESKGEITPAQAKIAQAELLLDDQPQEAKKIYLQVVAENDKTAIAEYAKGEADKIK